ncbi:unnamed protein product [Litomosoides sigmodontis]|uniref:Uncharacterized protein n=1 Tax=Litomosoides sigmodontis TaxID=42156 RepID=A0A3P6SXQ5_LITSI|nr:unnamed protein product [Litomosoides sigmodontis]
MIPQYYDLDVMKKSEMVKKMRESISQPVRQSHRTRILNIRLGTPPKILLDMLKDHSSSVVKTLPAIADVERIERFSQKAVRIPGKQNVESPSTTAQLSNARPGRQHNSSKRYAAPIEEMLEAVHPAKSVSNGSVTFALNESRKAEPLQSPKNETMHILSKPVNDRSSKIRHSSRIRVPNSRFGYLLPGFSEQSGNGKRNNNVETVSDANRNTNILPSTPEVEKVAHSPEAVRGKPDTAIRPRHSERQRIPSKRLGFPDDAYPVIQPQKKYTKIRPKMEEAHIEVSKGKNSNRKRGVLKTKLNIKTISKNLSLPTVDNNRQVHSSLEVPSILYPYRPARSQALCVEPSSSTTKDYISKKDVEELIVEINNALARITNEDYSELREKITHHLNSLYRENCRFRQALHQLKSEVDSLSSNSTVNCYNMLIKQNSKLREQKVLADIKCEAQMEEVRRLLGRIRILEIRNKNLEDFRSRLIEQKKRKHLNGGTKYRHDNLVNDSTKMETQDVRNAELDSLILIGIDGKGGKKDDKSNDDKMEWGNDSWMLHC